MVVFDIPRCNNNERNQLRKVLRAEGFGRLQNSVWITPRDISPQIRELCGEGDDLGAITMMSGRPVAGASDQKIVEHTWDFEQINRFYRHLISILEQMPKPDIAGKRGSQQLKTWAQHEWSAWNRAIAIDPLLPSALLPRKHLGKRAW